LFDANKIKPRFTNPSEMSSAEAENGRACVDTVDYRKVPCPYRESNPGRPARSPVATPTELFRL
jgi:hypothetical protein